MEEQTSVPESGTQEKTAMPQAEQYFIAAFKLAEWIPVEYKKLAAQSKKIEVWKALYICASDGVPVEKAIEAMKKNPSEGALAFVRQKHLEDVLFGNYEQELSSIKATTSSLETEVHNMSKALTQIAAGIPQLDAMFPDTDGPQSDTNEERQDEQSAVLPERQPEHMPRDEQTDGESDEKKSRTTLLFSDVWKKLKHKKQDSIPTYLEKCVEEGYSPEQLEYMMDCIEDGMSIQSLQRIVSPQLSVDMMQRLRKIEERKENKDKDGK